MPFPLMVDFLLYVAFEKAKGLTCRGSYILSVIVKKYVVADFSAQILEACN